MGPALGEGPAEQSPPDQALGGGQGGALRPPPPAHSGAILQEMGHPLVCHGPVPRGSVKGEFTMASCCPPPLLSRALLPPRALQAPTDASQ